MRMTDAQRSPEVDDLIIAEELEGGASPAEQAELGIAMIDRAGKVTWMNDCLCEAIGKPLNAIIGQAMHDLTDASDRSANAQLFQRTIDTGEAFAIEERLGSTDEAPRWSRICICAQRDAAGEILGAIAVTIDVTARREADARQRLLLGELQHRVRNTLGVVRSIARRTALNSRTVEEMASHLEGRIDAFARVQAMVTRRPGGGVDLAALIEEELIAHAAREGRQFSLSGPDVALRTKPAEALSLAFHELVTNAVKYGALAAEKGRIAVRWAVEDGRLDFLWEEEGGPAPAADPDHEGFGLELLRRMLPYDLKAEVEVDFRPEGLRFKLSLPLNEA